MEINPDPVKSLQQLGQQMQQLCLEFQCLKQQLDKFSPEQIQKLLPLAFENYIENTEFGEKIKKQARLHLGKFKSHFKDRMANQEVIIQFTKPYFRKLKETIEDDCEYRQQRKNEQAFECSCGQNFPTKNGLDYHILLQKKKNGEKEKQKQKFDSDSQNEANGRETKVKKAKKHRPIQKQKDKR